MSPVDAVVSPKSASLALCFTVLQSASSQFCPNQSSFSVCLPLVAEVQSMVQHCLLGMGLQWLIALTSKALCWNSCCTGLYSNINWFILVQKCIFPSSCSQKWLSCNNQSTQIFIFGFLGLCQIFCYVPRVDNFFFPLIMQWLPILTNPKIHNLVVVTQLCVNNKCTTEGD